MDAAYNSRSKADQNFCDSVKLLDQNDKGWQWLFFTCCKVAPMQKSEASTINSGGRKCSVLNQLDNIALYSISQT